MGTHPIFESDFDCLTEKNKQKKTKMASSQMEFILQNMQKELEGQVEKVSKSNKERETIGKAIGNLEAQLSETKVVLNGLEILKEDSIVYKLLGPVLVKQDKQEAVSNVKQRSDYMESELKRNEKALGDVDSKLKKEQAAYQDLYMKSQQVQKALQQGAA